MCLQFLFGFSWSNGCVDLLSVRALAAEAGTARISVYLRMHWSSKSDFFVHFALSQSNCNLCPTQVHIFLNPPTASTGGVFLLVAVILLGVVILTTEMFLLLLLMSWLYLQANL